MQSSQGTSSQTQHARCPANVHLPGAHVARLLRECHITLFLKLSGSDLSFLAKVHRSLRTSASQDFGLHGRGEFSRLFLIALYPYIAHFPADDV